jgi:predicted exporter
MVKRRALEWRILPRWAAILATSLVAALCALSLANLEIEKDITALLPKKSEDAAILALARDAGLMRKVVVAIGPDAPGSALLHRSIDAAAARARKVDGVAEGLSRIETTGAQEAAREILERAQLLYRPRADAMSAAAVGERLRGLKERLAAPEAIFLGPYLLADPLGFGADALKGLEASGGSLGTAVEGGHLFDAERRCGLVVLTVSFDPFDVERSARFIGDLDAALRAGLADAAPSRPLPFVALGGVHYAASSGSAVIHDIGLSFGLALSGIAVVALVLMVFLRRLRLLAVSFVPGGLGIAAGIAAMGLAGGRIHAVTLGFSATITGVSVDYAIHLLHRAAHAQRANGLSSRAAMERALAEVGGSICLGAAATVGSFVIVAFSGFTGVRELAVLSAISVAVAMLGTLLLLPPFHAFLLGGRTSAPPTAAERGLLFALERYAPAGPRRAAVLVAFAGAAALMALGAARARASGDPRDLSYRDPDLEARQAFVAARFPGLQDQAVLVAEGRSTEEALAANDALYGALLDAGLPRDAIASLSPILPSAASQEESYRAARAVLGRPDVAAAFAGAGFRPEYLAGLGAGPRPRPLDPSSYAGTALAPFVREALRVSPTASFAVTRVKASSDDEVRRLARIAASIPGVHLVSQRLDAQRALTELERELALMILLWFGVSFVLLAASRRSLAFAVRALVPPATGVLAALGVFGALGRPLTPVSVAAATLILGFGVDFGIFAQPEERSEFGAAGLGVVASALTTIAGFSALIFARVGALADIGLSITIGIAAAFLTALLVVPALSRRAR